MPAFLLALDQGTTSTRAVLFDAAGTVHGVAQTPLAQHYPAPGRVEHDATEIRDATVAVGRACLAEAGVTAHDVAAVGITNQRETTVVWDRRTGEPVGPAIVWQDRRTAGVCARLADDGLGPHVEATTGLRLDPYFSGTKLAWILDHTPGARGRAEHLAFGTVNAWLVWCLTGGPDGGVHATDVTNASRTMLWDLRRARWDDELLAALRIPRSVLPDVRPSCGAFGTIPASVFGADLPIRGVAGDQHAALVGQACLAPGQTKVTLGTGAFLLMHTGATPARSAHGLLTTSAVDVGAGPQFALEGSVFVAGAAVQWLRDEVGVVGTADETADLAASVPDSGGVVFVPAFTGLGAPHWDPAARGLMAGLTRGTTRAHLARATLEALAFQTRDVVDAMAADAGLARDGLSSPALRVDGGAARNPVLLQMLADVLGASVERPALVEATAWGAAALAGIDAGLLTPADVSAMWRADVRIEPDPASRLRTDGYRDWQRAVALSRGWATDSRIERRRTGSDGAADEGEGESP